MIKTIFSAALTMILTAAVVMTAQAQYDDVYFDPNRDAPASLTKGKRYDYTGSNKNTGDYTYDDKTFDYEDADPSVTQADDEYDFQYTSRIRRFSRPLYGFNYFDPYYVDVAYFDPYFTPGATVLIYDNFNSFGAFNSWRRWNRWNNVNQFSTWGWQPYTPFYNNWSWNRFNNNGFNSWDPWLGSSFNNNLVVNNFYGVGGGYVSNLYCPPAWGGAGVGTTYNTVNVINNNNANPNGTYYGPRSSGTTYTPNDNGRSRFLEAPREANTTPVRTVTNNNERNRNTVTAPTARPATTRDESVRRDPAPTATPAPSRSYDTPRYNTPAPSRTTTPAPSRTYESPRSTAPAPVRTPAPTRTYEAPRYNTPAPSRTYEAPRYNNPAPSRSYEAPRSSSPAPSRSFDAPRSSPAPSSAPVRTRGN